MSARHDFLQRVRNALGDPVGPPLPPADEVPASPVAPTEEMVRQFVAENELISRYEDRMTSQVHLTGDISAAAGVLSDLLAREAVSRVAVAESPLVRRVLEAVDADGCGCELVSGAEIRGASAARFDAGVTGCQCLVADTASILITERAGEGRALSLLPAMHITIATCSQLLPDLPAALASLCAMEPLPRAAVLITGASRTADIEQTLVIPAHGPQELHTILVTEP